MRSRVSDKKRKIIIISAIIFAIAVIGIFIWNLIPYTKSLQLDFKRIYIDCNNVTVLSDGNFETALSDGTVPAELVTNEVREALKKPETELCLVQIEYKIDSKKELDPKGFAVELSSSQDDPGKLYSYIPVTDVQNSGMKYTFKQTFLTDKKSVRKFLLEEKLPRAFQGPLDFVLEYRIAKTGEIKREGFSTD